MRVYLPATLTMLAKLTADGSLAPVSGTGFAVTPTLRESYSQGDDDELAEVAMGEAALASLRLLAAEHDDAAPDLPARRVVLVADVDVDGVTARPDLDDAVVRIAGPVAMTDIIACYVDIAAAESAVDAAVAVVDDADLGDEDAELTVGDIQDHDLAWYAAQEIAFLLELL